MDHDIERRYFMEKIADYARALEEFSGGLQVADENHVLFCVDGRPFEATAWISEDYDLVAVTTRTVDFPSGKLEDAISLLQATMEICWDHCVAVSPVEGRYDLSMAVFLGGFSFEAFEGVVHNLLSCAETIEESFEKKKQP
ncbi:MAG: hypothetical protein ABSE73_22625 [Planctomycetota bacterium]